MENYYELLGVSRQASKTEVNKAHRTLMRQWHPDRAGGVGEERSKLLNVARDTLLDPRRRADHNRELDAANGGGQVEQTLWEDGDEEFVPEWGTVDTPAATPPSGPYFRVPAAMPALLSLLLVALPVVGASAWQVAAFMAATGNGEDLWFIALGIVSVVAAAWMMSVLWVPAALPLAAFGVWELWSAWAANDVSPSGFAVKVWVAAYIVAAVSWLFLRPSFQDQT